MKWQSLFWDQETICMKCQSLISAKNKKNISDCRLLKCLPSMLVSIKSRGINSASFRYCVKEQGDLDQSS